MRRTQELVSVATAVAVITAMAGCGGESGSPAGPGSNEDGDVTCFADSSLELAVRQSLGEAVGSLTEQQLLSVTELDASDRGIMSLSGIRCLANLRVLGLGGNPLADIAALVRLDSLRVLDLSGTGLTELGPISELAGLEVLDLAGNQIEDLSGLTALEHLQTVDVTGTAMAPASLAEIAAVLEERGVAVHGASDVQGGARW